MITHKWHDPDMPCAHVPPEQAPLCTLHASLQESGGALKMWSGYDVVSGRGVRQANCIHGSFERAVDDSRHWRAWSGFRDWGAHGFPHSVGMISCVPCWTHPLFIRKLPQRIIPLSLRCGSGVQILISPECLAVVSSIIPPSVISALSCHMDLCSDLKDQATKCISRIFIAWTSTTLTIKNPRDHQTCTWNLLWLSRASLGLKGRYEQFSGPVNHVSSRNWLAPCGAPIQDQPLWPCVVFPKGGPCQ